MSTANRNNDNHPSNSSNGNRNSDKHQGNNSDDPATPSVPARDGSERHDGGVR